MNPVLPFAIQLAGALHLLVASANFVLPRILNYRENLIKVSPIIREIFLVHAAYIVLVLAGFGVICLGFPHDLCGASPLGKFFSGFLAIFWSIRVAIQFGFYDRATKKEHPVGNFFFSTIFLYFAVVFIAATFFGK
jgi:UDP-N-acetylmuramyl pentapeptide phosphotransferase/UDP-N-acetylglucosamine-1-phosphate transferase